MSRRLRPQQTEAPGQDSFLDIVANLVGILLILIMVVGLRTKDAIVQAQQMPPPTNEAVEVTNVATPGDTMPQELANNPLPADETSDPDPDPDSVDVDGAKQLAADIENNIVQLTRDLQKHELEIEYRRRERDRIQLLISTAERKLADKKLELNQQQQQAMEQQQQLLAAQREVEGLQNKLQALSLNAAPVERLEHLPTPMARTVFGKEEHFRLQGGRLAHVPWNDLVARLKEDAPNKIWKLKDTPKITETIGPLGGFRLRYTLKKSEQLVNVDGVTTRQERASLDYFHLLPISDQLGESVSEALQNPNSQLNNVLGANDPKSTTITVWVYPDSFEAFRELKQHLFQANYLTASRPMPAGQYMGGAPEGSRSASQ